MRPEKNFETRWFQSHPSWRYSCGNVKSTIDVHVTLLTKIINSSIRNGCFSAKLKAAEVTPIFKKNYDLDKENYRPVSVLPHVSKVFERIMYIQIENFHGYRFQEKP